MWKELSTLCGKASTHYVERLIRQGLLVNMLYVNGFSLPFCVMKLILLNGLITGITIERMLMLIINKK